MTRRPVDRVSLGVEALRRLTAEDGPVATVTRARVLERSRGRAGRRRLSFALGLVVPVIVSGALAAAILARRAPPFAPTPVAVAPVAKPISVRRAPVELPPEPLVPAAVPEADAELASYGAAHAAHFTRKDPAQALGLWTAYLARYPHGRFVPEATYNRALTLARLGRSRQAIAALKPIAAGRFGDYRRQEADALIGALEALHAVSSDPR